MAEGRENWIGRPMFHLVLDSELLRFLDVELMFIFIWV